MNTISAGNYSFEIKVRRVCDGDRTKYGKGWGFYVVQVGGATVGRHCLDSEDLFCGLSRFFSDKNLQEYFAGICSADLLDRN